MVLFLTFKREVTNSNLEPDNGYSESSRGFNRSPCANAEIMSHIRPQPLPSTSFPIHPSFLNRPVIRVC
jgi:hypothetical protein